MARPRKEFDKEQFEKLCAMQCTKEEIASFFDMTDDTLNTRCHETYDKCFSVVYKIYADDGKMSLRRKQIQVALNGNVSMLIWLGKQYLDQTEKQEQKIHANFDGDETASAKYAEFAGRIFSELDQGKSERRF